MDGSVHQDALLVLTKRIKNAGGDPGSLLHQQNSVVVMELAGHHHSHLQILDEELGERRKQYGREGMKERENSEIGVHVIRGGDIVGDHSVMFSGNFESITLSHRAYDRSVFAQGALRAARWVVSREPGIYGMDEVLALKGKPAR